MTNHAPARTEPLNALLRREIAAVETYRHTLARIDAGPAHATIEACLRTHERHVERLTEVITRSGATPAESSGMWGSLVKVIESGVDALGLRAVLTALEEAEELGLRDYRSTLSNVDLESREIIESELLRDQERTHEALAALKKTVP